MNNFHSYKVVGRGSETQLQVGENLNFNVALYGVNCVHIDIMYTNKTMTQITLSLCMFTYTRSCTMRSHRYNVY